jgi:hypothetical protein
VTHCEYLEYFTEVAQGVNPFGMERIKSIQLTYRLEAEEENRTAFIFTAQYDIPGFLGRLINKTIGEGMLRAAVKQNFERLKTYAETGRSV